MCLKESWILGKFVKDYIFRTSQKIYAIFLGKNIWLEYLRKKIINFIYYLEVLIKPSLRVRPKLGTNRMYWKPKLNRDSIIDRTGSSRNNSVSSNPAQKNWNSFKKLKFGSLWFFGSDSILFTIIPIHYNFRNFCIFPKKINNLFLKIRSHMQALFVLHICNFISFQTFITGVWYNIELNIIFFYS